MIGSSGLKILPVDNLDEAARSERERVRERERIERVCMREALFLDPAGSRSSLSTTWMRPPGQRESVRQRQRG